MYLALMKNDYFQEKFGLVAQSDFSVHKQQDENYWRFVQSFSASECKAISWNGNQHNIHFLLKTEYQFKCLGLNENLSVPVIPQSQIRELYKPTFEELKMVLNGFSKSASVILLGTPAPKDKQFLDKHLKNDPYFTQIGENLGISKKDLSATDNNIRAYMWKITQKMTQEVSAKYNYEFFPSPALSYNEASILFSDYYADDLTHANEKYGNLMLKELINHFGLHDE